MTEPAGQHRLWDELQTSGVASFSRSHPRQRYLVKRLRRGERVLNIGVGDASFERFAEEAGHDVSTLDPSAEAIARLTRARGAERCHVGKSEAMPFADASFGCVVMSEVLEHLDDQVLAATLREVRRVLAPGGRFIGTVPADERLADSEILCPECGARFHRFCHQRSFSAASLRATLVGGGFSVARVRRRAFPQFFRRGLVGFAKACVVAALGRMGEPIADPHYYFEATAASGAAAAA
jgi:SAM-dependent methyltransferase